MASTRSFSLPMLLAAIFCVLAIASLARGQESDDPMATAQQHINAQEWQEAADVLRGVTQTQPDNARAWLLLGYVLHTAGRIDEALPYHLMGAEFEQTAPVCMYNAACVYALKGNSDKAIAWLEKSIDAGFSQRQQIQTDPDLDSIRSDERFARIMDRMKVQAPRAQARGILPPDRREEQLTQARRQFDFWVGEWDVYTPDGKKAGTNSITSAHDGHALIEHWTSAKGSKGTSINYYNPSRRRWTQVWVDDGGNIINKTGRYIDGSMRFEGSHTLPTGERRAFRARFTPSEDGTVRQFIEESTDGGNTWTTWFDGIYVPKGEQPPHLADKNDQTDLAVGLAAWEQGRCVNCHGTTGTGTSRAPDLTDDIWDHCDGSVAGILGVLKTGVPRESLKDQSRQFAMNPATRLVTDERHLKALARYVEQLARD